MPDILDIAGGLEGFAGGNGGGAHFYAVILRNQALQVL
jgi:hypothetical protein